MIYSTSDSESESVPKVGDRVHVDLHPTDAWYNTEGLPNSFDGTVTAHGWDFAVIPDNLPGSVAYLLSLSIVTKIQGSKNESSKIK